MVNVLVTTVVNNGKKLLVKVQSIPVHCIGFLQQCWFPSPLAETG